MQELLSVHSRMYITAAQAVFHLVYIGEKADISMAIPPKLTPEQSRWTNSTSVNKAALWD